MSVKYFHHHCSVADRPHVAVLERGDALESTITRDEACII